MSLRGRTNEIGPDGSFERAVRAGFFSLSASYCFGGSAGGVAGAVPSADFAASAAEPAA
jgi:hypothetical protein